MAIDTAWWKAPVACAALFAALFAGNAVGGRLPDWVCNGGEPPLFADGFETDGNARYMEPSNGSGGAYPGAVARTVISDGQPHTYHLYIPDDYPLDEPLPVLLTLHGAGGPGTAPLAAMALRDAWSSVAEEGPFVVVAAEASGQQGGWLPAIDYAMLRAVIVDVAAHYNIDRSRLYGWGFSAGAHVMHELALGAYPLFPGPGNGGFAAYGISAGVLAARACANLSPQACQVYLSTLPEKLPVSLRVGTDDPYFPMMQVDRDIFLAAGWTTLEFVPFPEGHIIDPFQFPSTWAFLCPWQRASE